MKSTRAEARDRRGEHVQPESLSFIVPTFREDAFGDAVQALVDYLQELPPRPIEILVVDDSDDAMQGRMREEIARRFAALEPRISVRLLGGPRRGKGAAVQLAARASTGATVFIIDADLPVPLHFIGVFLETMRDTDAEVLVAERPSDRYAGKPLRHVVARSLRLIQRAVVFQGPLFEDTQCGFKAFRGPALRALAERQIVEGGMYDLEYLYAATVRHLPVQRVDVTTRDEVRPTRINVWRCVFFDPLDIVRLKVAGILGRYDG
jgi:dolichyl-phosphate beta-glucosyltransferase